MKKQNNPHDAMYSNLLSTVLKNGQSKEDRTNVGTLSVFSPDKMRFDLSQGFPILTTKYVHFKSILVELLWFLRGDTSIEYLKQNGVSIWDEWATAESDDVGRIYGAQWTKWRVLFGTAINQIAQLVENIKANPHSRRHVVSAWNVSELDIMALPPCHYSFCCYVQGDKLNLTFTMRSADMFLGVPFNVASYALLLHLLARATGLQAGEVVCDIVGDAHIYKNHLSQVSELLSRKSFAAPVLKFNTENTNIFSYTPLDFELADYQHHPKISAPVAV